MSEATPAAVATDELDDFAKVFASLSELKEGESVPADLKAPVPPAKTPEEIAAEEAAKAAAQSAEDPPADEELPPEQTPEEKIAADEAAAAAAKEKDSPTPAPAPADDRLEAALDKLADRLAPKPTKTEERQTEQMLPQLTTEEAQAYAKYVQEFPEIAAAETAIRRLEIKQAMTVVMKLFDERIGALAQPLNQVTTYSHKNMLVAAIPDYDAVRVPVIKWVDDQPAYLQAAYKQVVAEGSVEEIKDLVDRWRKETGTTAPAATPATPAAKDTKLPDAAKQAVARLAPVGTKRSTVVAAPSKEDFDGAFDTFAKEL